MREARTLAAVVAGGFAMFLAASAEAGVGIFTVGNGTDCPYRDIQAAVDAAAAHPGPDYVWIVDDHTYTGEQVLVTDTETVVIEGGFSTCDIPTPDSFSTVSGAGNGGGAVFTIRGAVDVAFQNLLITGASRDGDASGGGIDFDGTGSLELITTTVAFNTAGYGGGLNVKGEAGGATLTISHDTGIIDNTGTTSGGGIRIEGETHLDVLEPNTLIEGNHALNGYGGGIEVLGPARAAVGSPGIGGAVIQFNDAQNGGGVAVIAIEAGRGGLDPRIDLFTTDPANPVQISNNFASSKGGAIYLQSLDGTLLNPRDIVRAYLCADDFRINDNLAADGAAIYADWGTLEGAPDAGSVVYLNSDACNGLAVRCAPGVACNELSRNLAEDSNAQPTGGAAILIGHDGALDARRFVLRGSEGGTLVTGAASDLGYASIEMDECLIVDNHTQHELVHLVEGSLKVNNCTISHDAVDNGHVFYVEDQAQIAIELADDIVDESGILALDYAGDPANVSARWILSNDIGTLPPDETIQAGVPTFVDAPAGDYHLDAHSLGVDFAPPIDNGTDDGMDLDRNQRLVDLLGIPNQFGALDLGAYEIQSHCVLVDTLFCDGFDGTD